jgi:arylsulfatase A-like enzyme
LVNWPGRIPGGRVFETPTHVVDWLPTLIHAATGDPADDKAADKTTDKIAEGIDLWAALRGQSADLPDRTMYWKTPSASAVRQGDWKLIHHRGGDRQELFHLKVDPLEKTDLAGQEPERVGQLLALLKKLAENDL